MVGNEDFDKVDFDPKNVLPAELPDLLKSDDIERQALLSELSTEKKLQFTLAKICCLLDMLTHAEFLPRSF